MKNILFVLGYSILLSACTSRQSKTYQTGSDSISFPKGTFGYDVAYLKKYKPVIVLETKSSPAKVAVVGGYQGRVMTSTAGGGPGKSYGWINYNLIASDSLLPHMNPFGGEDRIWFGPEGGQYSVFFSPGSPFDFKSWQTPAVIDSEPYSLVSSDSTQATFTKSAELTNHSGFMFHFSIERQIKLWSDADIGREFGISVHGIRAVGFESRNTITNTGQEAWTRKNGLLSIWILGMLTPSDKTTIVLPYQAGIGNEEKITDDYFGKIPADRLVKSGGTLLMKGDGKFRGKVGLSPLIAKGIAGSYDAGSHILTLVKFDLDKKAGYVNSKWELQKDPFAGDAVNAYNDGPLASGGQLGPFYELESSSPANELKPGGTVSHHHITIHLEGDESALSGICKRVLGVSLNEIAQAFPEIN